MLLGSWEGIPVSTLRSTGGKINISYAAVSPSLGAVCAGRDTSYIIFQRRVVFRAQTVRSDKRFPIDPSFTL